MFGFGLVCILVFSVLVGWRNMVFVGFCFVFGVCYMGLGGLDLFWVCLDGWVFDLGWFGF